MDAVPSICVYLDVLRFGYHRKLFVAKPVFAITLTVILFSSAADRDIIELEMKQHKVYTVIIISPRDCAKYIQSKHLLNSRLIFSPRDFSFY